MVISPFQILIFLLINLFFKVASNKVSVSGNQITVDNIDPIGDYVITLSNSPDLSNLSAISTFA